VSSETPTTTNDRARDALSAFPDEAERLTEEEAKEAAEATLEQDADPIEYTASIFPGDRGTVPTDFAEAVLALQAAIGRPVWVLVNGPREPWDEINEDVRHGLFGERDDMRSCADGAVLLIDSGGGQARSAFQIAKLFRRHCGTFTVVVPRMAKSAATLLSLGAAELHLGLDAELGPLDVQLYDEDREVFSSALDEVQALERLNGVALDVADQAMFLLVNRTRKKTDLLLPHVLKFASDFMHPLLDKIDTVHYTQRSRVLKVAEDYAIRLLQPMYTPRGADDIAKQLVNAYSEHEFSIDRDEVREMLSRTLMDPAPSVQAEIEELERILTDAADTFTNASTFSALGRIERREFANGHTSSE
jgi:Serine dehydrogenase proteinase